MPDRPWQIIRADFFWFTSHRTIYYRIIDNYSRYLETEIIDNTSAKTFIPKSDAIFAPHGIQHTFKLDNGPQFNGNDFKTYRTKLGIKHEASTPDCSQGNSEAQSFHEAPAWAGNKNCSSRKSQLGPKTFQVRIQLSNHTTFLNEHLTCSTSI